jgi:hypothetical protein
MIRRDAIEALVLEHGREGYLQVQALLLEGKDLPNGRKGHARPEDFSLRSLWEGLVGPIESTLGFAADQMGYVQMPIREAVTTSAFPSAVGQLISAKVIEGYDMPGAIGDELVTVVPSKLRGERMVGFTSLQGPKLVEEGEPYQDSTFREKYVTTTEAKRGRLLSITEEAVFFDQTGQMLLRAQSLGGQLRANREKRIIRAVADVASTERVYRPAGVPTQLYSAGNNSLLATATPLIDWTDIQEALAYYALNQRDDREPDDSGGPDPIIWMPTHILVAQELAGTAARIVNAVEDRTNTATATVITAGVARQLVPGLRAVSSPFLDAAQGADQWDDASDWLIGDFKRQFIYKEIWPLQTFRAPAQNEEDFERDIVARFKVREYGDVNATDHRLVVKVNAV